VSVSWPEVERMLCRIPHVTRAHVVRDATDQVRELHIVATAGKPAKQLVRDVQSVAMAEFGVDVDRHVVSIVQLDEDTAGLPGRSEPAEQEVSEQDEARGGRRRTLLSGMTLQSQQGASSVSVRLRWGDREAGGSVEGARTARALHRMAAEATVSALAQLHPQLPPLDVEAVEVREVGGGRVALVRVVQPSSKGDHVLVGTANVRAAGEFDALARAVLDAVNRRLPE
jgi:hypothetical protein